MRLHGSIERWYDGKGYGFIAPTGGGVPVFVHVSAFPPGMRRPVQGEDVTFDMGRSSDGRACAVTVRWERSGTTPMPRASERPARSRIVRHDARHVARRREPLRRRVGGYVLMMVGFVAIVMAVSPGRFGQLLGGDAPDAARTQPVPQPMLDDASMVGEPNRASPYARDDALPFRCDERRYCRQMRSCDEAIYFLEHCPDQHTDGDHDGIPCEDQWCR